MTALARNSGIDNYFALTYESDAVGVDASAWRDSVGKFQAASAVTIEQRQAAMFWQIVSARCESEEAVERGEMESAISRETVEAAIAMLHALPMDLPDPIITAEDYGDITFEWYRDKRHVAVLGVDANNVRWSAIFGTDKTVAGSEPFAKTIPALALNSILKALD